MFVIRHTPILGVFLLNLAPCILGGVGSPAIPPICESRTINFITHSLPQSCLTTAWAHTEASSRQLTPLPSETADRDSASSESQDDFLRSTSTVGESDDIGETDGELAATPFMSFEDWKEMMLRQTGQDPQALKARKPASPRDHENIHPDMSYSGLGDEDEISLNFDSYLGRPEQRQFNVPDDNGDSDGDPGLEQTVIYEDGRPSIYRSKDAGKTCKERFSYSSFDAGATVLKTSPGAKNAKAILIENKDSYMLLECSSGSKYVVVELSDDILIDTIVLANFEFFSSMIRHFRLSVSDRYPVKADKWRELGIFEARNSRDIQPFLIENPQIWAKYVRIEFLTHYGKEYYCPVSLLRVHGSRMLDSWKDTDGGRDEEAHAEQEGEGEREGIDPPMSRLSISGEQMSASDLDVVPPSTSSTHYTATLDGYSDIDLWHCALPATTVDFQAALATCDGNFWHADGPRWIRLEDPAAGIQHPFELDGQRESVGFEESSWAGEKASIRRASVPSASTWSSVVAPEASISGVKDGAHYFTEPASNGTRTSVDMSVTATVPSSKSAPPYASTGKNRTSTTTTQSPASPTVQEGFFKAITKRLQQVESNLTLSLKYVEDQSRYMQETLQRSELKQLARVTSFLDSLNKTVLADLRHARDQYDQMWQSTVIALESQREQSQREIVALSTRLNVLADEVVFQKRMAIVQAVLLLSCLLLVIFSRGVPIPYIASSMEQPNFASYHHSTAASVRVSGLYARGPQPDGGETELLSVHQQSVPDASPEAASQDAGLGHELQYSVQLSRQHSTPPISKRLSSPPPPDLADDAPGLDISPPPEAQRTTLHSDSSTQHASMRKPLPALPEYPSSP